MRRVAMLGLLLAGLCATNARGATWAALVSDANFSSGSASLVDTGTNSGQAITTGGSGALGVAIAADARTAYVVNQGRTGATGQISLVDLTSSPPASTGTIDIPSTHGENVVIAPDGRKAYMSAPAEGQVFPIDLAATPPTVGAPINAGPVPARMAFTPDGATVYVINTTGSATTSGVTPIDVATDTAGTQITGLGAGLGGIAVTPDGTRLYVGTPNEGNVYPIALPQRTVGSPIAVGAGGSGAVAITPDGQRAYAAGNGVVPIDLTTNTAGTPIAAPTGSATMAVTPDSKTLYVTDRASDSMTPINTVSSTAGTAIALPGSSVPGGIAITPDQAPVASFTVTGAKPGDATTFDAAASTVRFGTIASYAWEFGDGATATTAGPTTSHTYAAAGTFTATVTETSSGGTSVGGTVYTGQTASSVGSASARTTRSVVVSSGAAPAVSLSAPALSFGTVGVGTRSDAKTVTATNTGNGALTISGVNVSGSEFALGDDTCGGHTVAAGASCTTAVTFTPAAGGQRDAQLTFTDDASGSPHTVALSGIGSTSGAVTGTVLDGTSSAKPPLKGAYVTLCTIALGNCTGAVTDAQGHYGFAAVKPGSYVATIFPPSGSGLSQGTRAADVATGQTVDAVTLLRADQPLPEAIGISTSSGSTSGGHPTLYWDAPFDINLPLVPLGASGTPNSVVTTTVFVSLRTAGTGQRVLASALSYAVRYGADGRAGHAVQLASPLKGSIASGFHFLLGGATTRHKEVTTTPAEAVAGATEITAQTDGLQRQAHGVLELSVAGVRSTADTTAQGSVQQSGACEIFLDFAHRDELSIAEAMAEVERLQNYIDDKTFNGGLIDARVYEQLDEARDRVDSSTEDYLETLESVQAFCKPEPPCTNDNIFSQDMPCPAGGAVAVDPSGNVFTKRGVPLEHAKVVLQRSDVAKGPFAALPDGDAQMAPNNRRNPDRTDIDGHFGWDVFPGFYRVRATRKGCKGSALTKGLPVPPPVFNLRLKLSCPGLHRAKTRTRVLAVRRRGPGTVVKIRVRSRRVPSGLVTVAGAHGFLRRGRTTVVVPARPKHVVARYAGNARWAPSRGRA